MKKYIDRDALLEYAHCQYGMLTARDIMDFPTVDVQPVKHGRWINLTPPEWRESYRKHWAGCIYWMCSECKSAVAFLSEDMPYDLCPNCGARMDLKDGDNHDQP